MALLLFVLSPALAVARQTVTNGSIAGTITDERGAALPGVTITVRSPSFQVAQLVKISESAGEYQFAELPQGFIA